MKSSLIKNTGLLVALVLAIFSFQLGTSSSAHALGDADLSINVTGFGSNSGFQVYVCSNGATNVSEFELSFSFTNVSLARIGLFPAGTTATTKGSFDSNSGVWNGLLESGQCVNLVAETSPTAAIGQTVDITYSIVSSVLEDTSPNVDPNTGNDSSTASYTIESEPELVLETRLLTTGEITASSVVTYEAKIKNLGPGSFSYANFFILAFVMPDGSTLDEVVDVNTNDSLELLGCNNLGSITNLGFTALASITGDVIACNLDISGSGQLPSGTEYPFQFNITAGAAFANGDAEVISIVEGNDRDTVRLFLNLAFNENPIQQANNNFQFLSYDPNALRVTIARCPGQGATTSNGTGCFNVSFNKDPYAPSFTAADINLGPGESVSEFTQLDSRTWRVVVTGIKPGSTFALTLKANSVLDYSAVLNDVQVLGENTIRFDVLPETGQNTDLMTPILLLLLGFGLIKITQKRASIPTK